MLLSAALLCSTMVALSASPTEMSAEDQAWWAAKEAQWKVKADSPHRRAEVQPNDAARHTPPPQVKPTEAARHTLPPQRAAAARESREISGAYTRFSTRQHRQIQNYRNGTALIINIHITHHGGTTFCSDMRAVGPVPSSSCNGGDNWKAANLLDGNLERKETQGHYWFNWKYEDTAVHVADIRPHFHFIGWEFGYRVQPYDFNVDWGYENLVSTIIMRHPLERFLGGGKCGNFHHLMGKHRTDAEVRASQQILADPTPETQGLYWEYAQSTCADNYALKILGNSDRGGPKKCQSPMPAECLETAKELLRQFTIVIDQDCMTESIVAMKEVLGMKTSEKERGKGKRFHHHPPLIERLANKTLYNFLTERFRLDIELYEFSKSLSILNCTNVRLGQEGL